MLQAPTQKFIFEYSAATYFYDLLENFHKYFVDDLILTGVGFCGQCMGEIDFEKNNKYETLYAEIIKQGVDFGVESIICQLYKDNILELECKFYDFGKDSGVNYIYMIQNTMNWTSQFNFNCSVFSLIEPNINTIEEFWRS